MSCCAFSQNFLQTSIYGYRDTVVKAIFESGRKSKVEAVYQIMRTYPITVGYLKRTKYYRQNDSFVVHTSYQYPPVNPRTVSDNEMDYYDSQFHRIGSETIKDNKSYNRNDYMYDNTGRITRHVTYRDSNVIAYLREYEYHDKERFFVERGSPYTKTYYDSLGEYIISYSAPDSSKDWTDSVDYNKYRKIQKMGLIAQIPNYDPDISVIDTATCEFDSEDRPIKISNLDKNKHLVNTENYIYALNGRILEENTVRVKGDTAYRLQYFYDERNNLIELRRRRADGRGNVTYNNYLVTTYTYDKMNRLLIRQIGSAENASILSNKYDDRGDLIEYKIVDNGEVKELSEYTYEY